MAVIIIGSLVLDYAMLMVTKKNDNRVEKITLAEKNDIVVKDNDVNNKTDNEANGEAKEHIDTDNDNEAKDPVDTKKPSSKNNTSVDNAYGGGSVKNVATVHSSDSTENQSEEEIDTTVSPEDVEGDTSELQASATPENSESVNSSSSSISVEFYEGEPQITEYNGWKVTMMISTSEGDIRELGDLTETEAFSLALAKVEKDYTADFETKEVLMYFFDDGLGSNVRYYYGWIGASSDETQFMFEINSTTGAVMSVVKC